MKKIHAILFGILISLSTFFGFLYSSSFKSSAAGFTGALDSGSLSTLQNSFHIPFELEFNNNSASNGASDVITFLLSYIAGQFDNVLYETTGKDFEDYSWMVEDGITQDYANHIAGGPSNLSFWYNNLDISLDSSDQFYCFSTDIADMSIRAFGQIDNTGHITNLKPNMMVKFGNDYIDSVLDFKSGLAPSQDYLNFTSLGRYYSKHLEIAGTYDRRNTNYIQFPTEVLWCNYDMGYANVTAGIVPSDVYNDLSASDVYIRVWVYNDQQSYVYGWIKQSVATFTVNGNSYTVFPLECTSAAFGSTYVNSGPMQFYNVANDNLRSLADSVFSSHIPYAYNVIPLDVEFPWERLAGHWVSTDELSDILDGVVDLPIFDDTDGLPRIHTGENSGIGSIADTVDDIITRDEVIEGELDPYPDPDNPTPTPMPDPGPYYPAVFTDLLDLGWTDIFKPIFDIVGTQYSMHGLWMAIPVILVFVLVVYIVVSLL